jgi:hypothetical protein
LPANSLPALASPDYLVNIHLPSALSPTGSDLLARNNYGFEKRQKELRRQLKKEEKKQRKLDRAKEPTETKPDEPESPGSSTVP